MDLFESTRMSEAPLSERMRASQLNDFIGQNHLISSGSLLTRAIKADRLGNCIFYGPPGTGKTTLANIIAKTTNSDYVYLNAVSSGVADAKKVIDKAKNDLALYGKRTYLLLDECHRWSKSQSDCVLSAMEKGEIVFIGSTTENPYVAMTRAIISRCRVFEFKPLTTQDVVKGLKRAIADKERGLGNYAINIDDITLEHFAWMANGDMRNALNSLELAVMTTDPNNDGSVTLTPKIAEESSGRRALSIDESMYYDILSAFCKSLRGSDPDAGLYYASRLLNAGCDPMLICRRLVVHSAEDVGMADPNALNVATNAMYAMEKIGMPEGRLPLAEAIVYVCLAPKSNSVYCAMAMASEASKMADDSTIPSYLRDKNFKGVKDTSYKYPHDFGGYVDQNYMPTSLQYERFYTPSTNGYEKYVKIPKIDGEFTNKDNKN
ncbi:MAG: replication-associated recombination protein A [Bacillota bacterium]